MKSFTSRGLKGLPTLLVMLGWLACPVVCSAKQEAVVYPAVDLTRAADGVYPGSAEHRGFTYQVEVTLLNHRITQVQILSNKNSRYGRKAAGVVPLIIEQQKAGVDGISGATRCSTGLKRAVSDALQKALPVAP